MPTTKKQEEAQTHKGNRKKFVDLHNANQWLDFVSVSRLNHLWCIMLTGAGISLVISSMLLMARRVNIQDNFITESEKGIGWLNIHNSNVAVPTQSNACKFNPGVGASGIFVL